MAEDQSSKTEKATPKRRKEARAEGQIPRSVDVVQWGVLVAATFFMPPLMGQVMQLLQVRSVATIQMSAEGDIEAVLSSLWGLIIELALLIIVMMAVLFVMVAAGMAVQGGVVLSGKALKPKLSRLSPKQGFKRIASPDSIVDTAKSVLRLIMLGIVVFLVIPSVAADYLHGGVVGAREGVSAAGGDLITLLRLLAVAGLLIGLGDIGFQRWRTERKLKMSKDEVKQEMKSTEGNPEVRARRRQAHRQLSQNQMLAAVGEASVLVVNPIHVAVAISYSEQSGAPKVVAKGRDDVAERIRARAVECDVPMVESRPLAWVLYDTTEVGKEVPVELYQAVALVLAFVMQTKPGALSGLIRRVNVPASALAPASQLVKN